jgi:hypothetical protein
VAFVVYKHTLYVYAFYETYTHFGGYEALYATAFALIVAAQHQDIGAAHKQPQIVQQYQVVCHGAAE